MRRGIYRLTFLLLISLFIGSPQGVRAINLIQESPESWQNVAAGIDYQVFYLSNPDPVNVFVTRMDRNNPNVTIETGIAYGKLASGRETVKEMVTRYDQAINYWGQSWGGRNKVVVAINGYFFDGATGTPWSGVVHSGWYAKRFWDPDHADAGFAWTLNRNAFIGSCVFHYASKNIINFVRAGYSPNIREVNAPGASEELILYTPQYDTTTRSGSSSPLPRVEILVELSRPALLLPTPNAYALGQIQQIRTSGFSTAIPFDHVVITGWGEVGDAILSRINSGLIDIGDEIRISQEISNCAAAPQVDWTKTYASLGGDYHFLSDGVIRTNFSNPDADVRNSRTAIAYNANYVYFIVVDAFDPGVSEGMNISHLANFSKNTLGATWGVTMDSGTSSTMAINNEYVNNVYCNYTRDCGMVLSDEEQEILREEVVIPPGNGGGDGLVAQRCVDEPCIGTGLLMVVVEPKEQSVTFSPNEIVLTVSSAELRLGPGTNYASIETVGPLTAGTVLNRLPGVLAKNSYWWKVDFNGQIGWIVEDALLGGSSPTDYRLYLPSLFDLDTGLNRVDLLDRIFFP